MLNLASQLGRQRKLSLLYVLILRLLVPETGIEPVRPLFTKRRILSPLCLPISPLGQDDIAVMTLEARPGVEPG